VVNVTDSSDVYVRLCPLELGLGHCGSSSGLACKYTTVLWTIAGCAGCVYLCYSGQVA